MRKSSWPTPLEYRILGRGPAIMIPRLSDPRYYFWVLHVSFYLLILTSAHLVRPFSLLALAVTCASAATVDLLANYWKGGKLLFPQSGLITGSGISLLLEAPLIEHYAMAGAIGALSKHLFTYRGRHVFNPNTFGLMFCIMLLSGQAVSSAGQWGGYWWIFACVAVSGAAIAWYAKVLDLAIFWLLFFAAGAVVRSILFDYHIIYAIGTMSGAAFMLFTFFMITDPQTAPDTRPKRALFCLIAVFADAVIRHLEHPNSVFFALLFTNFTMVVLEELVFSRPDSLPAGSGAIPGH